MTIGTVSIILGVLLLIFLKFFFKSENSPQSKGFHGIDQDELFKEDLEYDPSWTTLSSNTHHTEDD